MIDVQNDFCPGGPFGIPGANEIIPVLNEVGAKFNHVVLVQDWHPPDHCSFASQHPGLRPFDEVQTPHGAERVYVDHCVRNTPGAEFHAGLDIPHTELVLRKGVLQHVDSNSAFIANDQRTPTGLEGYLKAHGCRHVYVAGLAFDGCVRRTADHGHQLGFEVSVIVDASAGIKPGRTFDEAMAQYHDQEISTVYAKDLTNARPETVAP